VIPVAVAALAGEADAECAESQAGPHSPTALNYHHGSEGQPYVSFSEASDKGESICGDYLRDVTVNDFQDGLHEIGWPLSMRRVIAPDVRLLPRPDNG
jgi:hypothetical protein